MNNATDLDRKVDKAKYLSHPHLWSFSLRYWRGMRWQCTIQESHWSGVHIGMGETWTEAVDEAIVLLEKSKETI